MDTKMAKPKKLKARTMADLTALIYKVHGWKRKKGESRIARCKTIYHLCITPDAEWFAATPWPEDRGS